MKLAVIGTSWITQKFISAARTVDGIDICACFSRSKEKAEQFATENNIDRCFCNIVEMAKDKSFDAVYIASPNKLHYEQSKLFLQNNKHVLCEKPATRNEQQSDELFNLAESSGLIYAEAIMSLHRDAFALLCNEIKSIGNIRTVNLVFCQLSSKYNAYLEGKNPNIFNPELETGCLMDIGVYNLYLAAALFGEPKKILSAATFLNSGADAQGSAILFYENYNVNLSYSKTGQSYSPSEIIGDKGTISIDSISQLTGIDKIENGNRINLVPYDLSRDKVMSGEAKFFLEAVRNPDYNSNVYIKAKNTAKTVRKMCDIIRRQNNFPF